MQTSQETDKILAALARVQSQMIIAAFDSVNPAFKSKYAGYASIRALVDGPLAGVGIVLLQPASVRRTIHRSGEDTLLGDPEVVVLTRLWHAESGQWIEEELAIPPDRMNAHGIGSARTYAMRYGLASLLAIATGEDDDGNAAAGIDKKQTRATTESRSTTKSRSTNEKKDPKPRASTTKPCTEKQTGLVKLLMNKANLAHGQKIAHLLDAMGFSEQEKAAGLDAYKVTSLDEATHEQLEAIRTSIFKKMTTKQASDLIEKLRPSEDRTAALTLFSEVVAKYESAEVDVPGLLKAHFKTDKPEKLSADELTKAAELVEAHAKPTPKPDDLPDY